MLSPANFWFHGMIAEMNFALLSKSSNQAPVRWCDKEGTTQAVYLTAFYSLFKWKKAIQKKYSSNFLRVFCDEMCFVRLGWLNSAVFTKKFDHEWDSIESFQAGCKKSNMQNILLNTFHLKTRSCSRRNGGNVNLVCIASETGRFLLSPKLWVAPG